MTTVDDDDADYDDSDEDREGWRVCRVRVFYLSGTCLDRSVPIEGKYMPTQASNTKKPASTAAMDDPQAVATAMDDAAETSIPEVMSSIDTPRLIRLWRGKMGGRGGVVSAVSANFKTKKVHSRGEIRDLKAGKSDLEKRVLPMRHEAMKHEKTLPKGTVPLTTFISEGGHWVMVMISGSENHNVDTVLREMIRPLDTLREVGDQ